jgi:hypothetical protein
MKLICYMVILATTSYGTTTHVPASCATSQKVQLTAVKGPGRSLRH